MNKSQIGILQIITLTGSAIIWRDKQNEVNAANKLINDGIIKIDYDGQSMFTVAFRFHEFKGIN